jgi:cytohesin
MIYKMILVGIILFSILQSPAPLNAGKLHDAALQGDVDEIRALLKGGADVNRRSLNEGLTPLHAAVCGGHMAAVDLLIESGADLEAKSNEGMTPLYTAAVKCRKLILQLLLENGARVNTRDNDLNTPLIRVVAEDCENLFITLLDNGADVEAVNCFGCSALHAAAIRGNRFFAEILIAEGAGVNVENDEGDTPLDLAEEMGHQEISAVLESKGAY